MFEKFDIQKFRLATFFFVGAAILFAVHWYVFGPSNQRPVCIQLPRQNQSVRSSFELTTSGNFRVEIAVPLGGDKIPFGLPELPPVPADLALELTRGDVPLHVSIKSLTRGARFEAGRLDFYYGDARVDLGRGAYEFLLTNHGSLPFVGPGVVVSLVRDSPPTETFLLVQLVQFSAWLLLMLGVVLLAVGVARRGR